MHISEGVLSAPVLAGGAILAAGGVALGLQKIDDERIPRVAVLTSAFFVASLIHVPVGPSSAHLILNGLAGVILGWAAFPAILVALVLQAMFFGFGGLTTLGVNTVNLALPAVICGILFRRSLLGGNGRRVFFLGAVIGALAIAISSLMVAGCLFATGEAFTGVAQLVLLAHVPVMIVEGLVTGSVVCFLRQVKPDLLNGRIAEKRCAYG